MDYSLLKVLIGYVEEYEHQHSSEKVQDFIVWLNNRLFSTNNQETHSAHDELLIAFKLMHINKELKKQTKSVLSGAAISSVDEYSFLLHLDHQESFRKMELVELHNLEAPTGIEIIKRLLKNKLIEESPDKDDKRAKRIKITVKGKQEVKRLQPQMENVFTQITDPLQLGEKIRLSALLNKIITSN